MQCIMHAGRPSSLAIMLDLSELASFLMLRLLAWLAAGCLADILAVMVYGWYRMVKDAE
jgi:hypothetical protein